MEPRSVTRSEDASPTLLTPQRAPLDGRDLEGALRGALERHDLPLRADLEVGAWDRHHGELRTQPEFVGALRLITGFATT